MKIGIDASALCTSLTGIGWFIWQVVRIMSQLEPNSEFILYTPRPLVVSFEQANVRIRFVRPPVPIPGFFWRQMRIPQLAVADRLDCFWGPASLLPVNLPPRIRAVVTVHDLVGMLYPELMTRYNGFVHRLFFRRSAERADAIISVSASTKSDLIKYLGCDPAGITVIHQGVEAQFRPLPRETVRAGLERLKLEPGYLLSVGTLEPRKNHVLLFRALVRLPDLPTVVMVGGHGWRYKETVREVSRLGLESRVRFLDYVPIEDLPVILNGARLMVIPSLYEGFGLPIIQAMACGTPVLASDTSSLPEIGGDVAAYFISNSLESLCDRLRGLLHDEPVLQRMRARGVERAHEFTWERNAHETLAVLHATCGLPPEAG